MISDYRWVEHRDDNEQSIVITVQFFKETITLPGKLYVPTGTSYTDRLIPKFTAIDSIQLLSRGLSPPLSWEWC